MFRNGIHLAMILACLMLVVSTAARAQSYNALKECIAVSPLLDDIHVCMDNYLDILDSNLASVSEFLNQTLVGEPLAGFERSQSAFEEYRRQNCLWYLDFSSPRVEAEQIAKSCLARMSQQRLRELRALVTEEDNSGQTLTGFYVYGPGRNSFQPCGSDERYWLEGDNAAVSSAQQFYVSLATNDLQVMYAVFAGTLDESAQAPEGHQGVFRISALINMGLPTESDCRPPGELADSTPSLDASASELASLTATPGLEDDVVPQDEPQQQLIAYFGAWVVDCTEINEVRLCRLEVTFGKPSAVAGDEVASLVVFRQKQQQTELELIFPGREIDSPARIRWRVDAFLFGDIVGSEIRVDEYATRQLVPGNDFVMRDVFPMMMDGTDFSVELLDSVDDYSGEELVATLMGLTRALNFADDFVRYGSN